MKFLLFLPLFLFAQSTVDLSDSMNVRIYEIGNTIEYSSRYVIYKNEDFRIVGIFRQKYDYMARQSKSELYFVKMIWYFK